MCWPSWWRGVKRVEKLEHGNGDGIGALYRHEWRSVIPYPVRFETRITSIERPFLIEAEADGELAGTGRWRFFDGREPQPTAGAVDSQSVKCAPLRGPRGYDGGKKGGRPQAARAGR